MNPSGEVAGSPTSLLADVARTLRAAGCVFAEDEARLLLSSALSTADLETAVARRTSGEPLEHVLGWAEFCGLRVEVRPGVFVPRRRSELLVDVAATLLRRGAVVVDLCCGTGAIGAALLHRVPGIEVHAADVEAVAVDCARQNLGDRGDVHEGDLFGALPSSLEGRLDAVVVNAPYVPTPEIELMPPEARLHEPAASLDGGPDGLDVQRRVLAEAPRWLRQGGHVVVETSRRQAAGTVTAAQQAGLPARVVRDDERDATAVVAGPAGRDGGRQS